MRLARRTVWCKYSRADGVEMASNFERTVSRSQDVARYRAPSPAYVVVAALSMEKYLNDPALIAYV